MSDDLKEEALKEELLKTEAREFFARVFRGSHHHGPLRGEKREFWVNKQLGKQGAATYNDDLLTRFVWLCHERCWRGSVHNGGPTGLTFRIIKRERIEDRPDEEMSAVHPTLQQAVECLESSGHWGTYWHLKRLQ